MGCSEQEEFQSIEDPVKHQSLSFGPDLHLKFKENTEKNPL